MKPNSGKLVKHHSMKIIAVIWLIFVIDSIYETVNIWPSLSNFDEFLAYFLTYLGLFRHNELF